MENGAWQPAKRYESKLLDSIGFKCRVNAVARDGLVLGVVSVHDFGKFHTMVFVHYDPATKEWKGPLVEAPFNQPNIDGACPMFTAGGDRMIWSAGYDRGPGPVSTSGGTGSTYDLFWLKTSDIVAYPPPAGGAVTARSTRCRPSIWRATKSLYPMTAFTLRGRGWQRSALIR